MLSPELSKLLDAADFDRIVNAPALHDECKRTWEAMSRAARAPAGREGVTRVVASRFPLFPQPERSEAEWVAWWGAYYDALEDLPEESLEGAMRAYVREVDAEFMPKPGRLRELALKVPTKAAAAASLAARAAAFEPARMEAYLGQLEAPRTRRMPTAAERAKGREEAMEVCRRLAETAAKRERPAFTFTQAPTDEGGLTAAMRAHLARNTHD